MLCASIFGQLSAVTMNVYLNIGEWKASCFKDKGFAAIQEIEAA
jgi:hypothetical protein